MVVRHGGADGQRCVDIVVRGMVFKRVLGNPFVLALPSTRMQLDPTVARLLEQMPSEAFRDFYALSTLFE